jgi:predicted MFS family arabinose efflux permease
VPPSAVGPVGAPTEPLPITPHPIPWKDMVHALRFPGYRRYAIGLTFSGVGSWVARIAIDWLALESSGSTGFLGVVLAIQLVPQMILGVWGGVVADRVSPRAAVILTQLFFALTFVGLGVAALTATASVPLILVISAFIGLAGCVDGPARARLTAQSVSWSALPNAISLNAVIPQIGGIVGAALAGVAIATIGTGGALLAAGLGQIIGAITVMLIHPAHVGAGGVLTATRGTAAEAVRYAARKPAILVSLLMIATLSLSALASSPLLAWMAESAFDAGSSGYSLYSMVVAVGALAGSILSARRRRFSITSNALLLGGSGIVWMLCGATTSWGVFVVSLVASGFLRMLFLVANDTLTQLSSNPAIRGRIVGLYLAIATGGQAIGSLALGGLVASAGGYVAFLITGAVPLIVAAIIVIVARAKRPTEHGV